MKHDWEYKKLGEVCEVSAGQGAPQGEQSYCENGTPFIKAGNLEDLVNGLDEGNVQKVSQSIAQKHKLKLYKAGSVLFAKSGMSCMKGYVHVLQRDCYVVSHLSILTPKTIEGHFLKYYLRFTKTYSLVKDEAYPSISLSDIASFPVPVPALAVQERIVGELDKVSEIIEKKKQQVKELDSLAQSIFYDMFGDPVENEKGWEVKSMNDVAPLSEYRGEHPDKDGKYWLLNLDKVESQTGRILDIDYYGTDEIGTSVISFDTSNVLYSKLRPYLNKVVIPNQIGYATSELVPLKPQKDILDRYYLAYMLRSNAFVSFINIKVAGAKMPRVSMGTFRGFMVPLPPLTLQQAFAEKVEAIEKQKELITASLKEAERLFDARMEYWFGE